MIVDRALQPGSRDALHSRASGLPPPGATQTVPGWSSRWRSSRTACRRYCSP